MRVGMQHRTGFLSFGELWLSGSHGAGSITLLVSHFSLWAEFA